MSCVLGCSHGDDELLNFNSLHIFLFTFLQLLLLNFAPWVGPVLALLEHLKPLIIGETAENYQTSCCACAAFLGFIFFLGVDAAP